MVEAFIVLYTIKAKSNLEMGILEKALRLLEEMVFCPGHNFSQLKGEQAIKKLLGPFLCKNMDNKALESKGIVLISGIISFLQNSKIYQKLKCAENFEILQKMFETHLNPTKNKEWPPWIKYKALRKLAGDNAHATSKIQCPNYHQYSLISF